MSNVEFQSGEMLFEWDSEKAELNWQKHTVDFEEAAKVFDDPNRIEQFDEEHSVNEDRYITVGMVSRILFVVYTERGEVTRLISARKANAKERRDYYAGTESH